MTRAETDIRLALRAGTRGVAVHDIIDGLAALNRLSRTLHRMAEDDCNIPVTDDTRVNPRFSLAQSASREKRIAGALKRAAAWALVFGGTIEHKTDPRAGCGLVVTVDGQEFYLANSAGR